MLNSLRIIAQQLLYPAYCPICRQKNQAQGLCSHCQSHLYAAPFYCFQCGLPLANQSYCGQCLKTSPAFDFTLACFSYQDDIRYLLQQLKFNQQLHLAPILANLALTKIQAFYQFQSLPECLIAVPLHSKRLKQRGYNQALELTKYFSSTLSLPYRTDLCQRIKPTKAQTEITYKARKKNLQGAFNCDKPLPYKHIALIDDVMTSGHTLNALAKSIKHHGPLRIDCWCIARAHFQ